MRTLRRLATFVLFLLPGGPLKNRLLNWSGHDIAATAHIAPVLVVDVARFELADGARIGLGNVFRQLTLVSMGELSTIGQWNWISAAPMIRAKSPETCVLRLGRESAIVSRHFLDCAGSITLDDFAMVAGNRSMLMTHGMDLAEGSQKISGIRIGKHSLLNSGNKVNAGSLLPDCSATTMGAVLSPGLVAEGWLYSGDPAAAIREVGDGAWFSRTTGFVEF